MPWKAETQSPHSQSNSAPQEVNVEVKGQRNNVQGWMQGKYRAYLWKMGRRLRGERFSGEEAPRCRRLCEWWAQRDSEAEVAV